jgi:hypothetical protein
MTPLLLFLAMQPQAEDLSSQLLTAKRVYVDKITGGETAAQMRELIISSLHSARLFILTENQERADMILRGAAEDLIFTEAFSSSEGVNIHAGASANSASGSGSRVNGVGGTTYDRSGRALSLGVGENEAQSSKERRHEALATVRLVNKDGDVVWSTTQESTGAKFRGASADVAEKIMKQLVSDYQRLKGGGRTETSPRPIP